MPEFWQLTGIIFITRKSSKMFKKAEITGNSSVVWNKGCFDSVLGHTIAHCVTLGVCGTALLFSQDFFEDSMSYDICSLVFTVTHILFLTYVNFRLVFVFNDIIELFKT